MSQNLIKYTTSFNYISTLIVFSLDTIAHSFFHRNKVIVVEQIIKKKSVKKSAFHKRVEFFAIIIEYLKNKKTVLSACNIINNKEEKN